MSKRVFVKDIAYQLPERVVTNDDLKILHPDWNMDLIASKTGVLARQFVKEGELASDLAYQATIKVLESSGTQRDEIAAIIFCTQSPDYIMPPNSALLHARLGLSANVAAFDFTLACSGFVYGLAIAKSMMESLGFKKVLLITADTYSKYIHPQDRSTLTLFGDAAAATILESDGASDAVYPVSHSLSSSIIDLALFTDGLGADKFMVEAGALRVPKSESTCVAKRDLYGNVRSRETIHMDGMAVLSFADARIPESVHAILERNHVSLGQVKLVLFHQASLLALERLCASLDIPPEKTYSNISRLGNTVSASLPILLKDAEGAGRLARGDLILLAGFGVGFSWGTCLMRW